MQTDSRVAAGVRAALAAALGYVILWIVLEAGESLSEKRIVFDAPTTFTWTNATTTMRISLSALKRAFGASICREKDRLLLQCDEVQIDERRTRERDADFSL